MLKLNYLATYDDVSPGVTYQFRIKAGNSYGFASDWSGIVSITANAQPDPVGIVTTAI
jgi:hypothetical protein